MKHEIRDHADIDALEQHWGFGATAVQARSEGPRIQEVSDIGSIRMFAAQKLDFLVEGVIAVGTITLISGDPGCGKTTLATAICSAVERGVPFSGLAVKRRPVLILDRENPLPVVIERFDRLGITDSQNFKIWGGWLPEEAPEPQSPIVARWVEACNPKPLILVDSLVGFNEGDENSATETREFFKGLRHLADLGATIIVLHHSGKADSAQDYRGSSDIKAAIDVGYKLANFGDACRLTTLRLKAFKARFTVQAETIFHYANDQFEMDLRPSSRTNEELLKDILIENPGSSRAELENLAADKGVKRGRVRDVLDQWEAARLISVQTNDRRRKSHFWVGSNVENHGGLEQ